MSALRRTGPVRLSRDTLGRPAAPVAAAHLGLGNFFRAHQAVYTDRAPDAEAWGIAAFTGRSADLAQQMAFQDGLFTVVEHGPTGSSCAVVSSVSAAVPAADIARWLSVLAAPTTRLVTLTVTEAAYLRSHAGSLAMDHPNVRADVEALRARDLHAVRTVPGRLAAGLTARHDADGSPIAVVPCDNLMHNGQAVQQVVSALVEEADGAVATWVRQQVSFVDSVVDRITPRATDEDRAVVRRSVGADDTCPVATEPFSEWVLSGQFPAGRPAWEASGAEVVDDVTPYEQRKLWLLNGAHSLLAYAGGILGHRSVAAAVADELCLAWIEQWWDEAERHLALPEETVADYRRALLQRFANPGVRHLLAQIAADGSQKLPVRALPVLAAERRAGRLPPGGVRILAAWVLHLRGIGVPITDPRAEELGRCAEGDLRGAVPRVLELLDPTLSADTDLVAAVTATAEELEHR